MPCKLTFKGEKKYVVKVEKLIQPTTDITVSSTSPVVAAPTTIDVSSPGSSQDVVTTVSSTSTAVVAPRTSDAGSYSSKDVVAIDGDNVVVSDSKKRKVVDEDHVNKGGEINDGVWIRVHGSLLKNSDKLILLLGNELDDRLINATQNMIIVQFPLLKGLRSTLIQYHLRCWTNNYLQIVHCRSSH